jgi:ribosome biogenesis protein BRX1
MARKSKKQRISHQEEEEVKDKARQEKIEEEMDEKEEENDETAERNEAVMEKNGDDDDEEEAPACFVSDGRYHNKQRCLVLCSRGVTARYRHLLEDLRTLMPHHKKESKLDPGAEGAGRAVNDIMQMRSCNSVLFLECRKKQDCYMWLGLAGGPSARFHISNIHTMDELRLTGNCMKGSRPLLTFDESFDRFGHLKLLKEMFVDIFGTPRGHPKSKPFVDRILAFYYADKKVSNCDFRKDLIIASKITSMMSVCRTVLLRYEIKHHFKDYDGMRPGTLSLYAFDFCVIFPH